MRNGACGADHAEGQPVPACAAEAKASVTNAAVAKNFMIPSEVGASWETTGRELGRLRKKLPVSPVACEQLSTTPVGCAKPGDAGRATWAVNRRRSCDVFFVRPRGRNASRREHRA